jgi:hypothetical protein
MMITIGNTVTIYGVHLERPEKGACTVTVYSAKTETRIKAAIKKDNIFIKHHWMVFICISYLNFQTI